MCSELCKDFYVVYQLEMVASEVESSCQLVVTSFFLVSPYQTIDISLGQPSPPSYQMRQIMLQGHDKEQALARVGLKEWPKDEAVSVIAE